MLNFSHGFYMEDDESKVCELSANTAIGTGLLFTFSITDEKKKGQPSTEYEFKLPRESAKELHALLSCYLEETE